MTNLQDGKYLQPDVIGRISLGNTLKMCILTLSCGDNIFVRPLVSYFRENLNFEAISKPSSISQTIINYSIVDSTIPKQSERTTHTIPPPPFLPPVLSCCLNHSGE